MWPPPASRTVTALGAAERNDEEGLSVLHGRAAGHEHLADLAIGRCADLGHVTEGLDPAEHVAARAHVAGTPLARDAEHPDRGRVYAVGLPGRRLFLPHRDRAPTRS